MINDNLLFRKLISYITSIINNWTNRLYRIHEVIKMMFAIVETNVFCFYLVFCSQRHKAYICLQKLWRLRFWKAVWIYFVKLYFRAMKAMNGFYKICKWFSFSKKLQWKLMVKTTHMVVFERFGLFWWNPVILESRSSTC